MDVFTPGDHGSTFGGNSIAAAVGLAALDTLIDERLVEHAAIVGTHLLRGLASIDNPVIREVRGRGLFTGVELHRTWRVRACWLDSASSRRADQGHASISCTSREHQRLVLLATSARFCPRNRRFR
jgi:acetylornithine/succinyldiaminopimelate/putrescine aminotransferase